MEAEIGPAGFEFLTDGFYHHDAQFKADPLPFFEPDASIPFFTFDLEDGAFFDAAQHTKADVDGVENIDVEFGHFAVLLIDPDIATDFLEGPGAHLLRLIARVWFEFIDIGGAVVAEFDTDLVEVESVGQLSHPTVFVHLGFGRIAARFFDEPTQFFFLPDKFIRRERLVVASDDAVYGLLLPGIAAHGENGLRFQLSIACEFAFLITALEKKYVSLLGAQLHPAECYADQFPIGNGVILACEAEREGNAN